MDFLSGPWGTLILFFLFGYLYWWFPIYACVRAKMGGLSLDASEIIELWRKGCRVNELVEVLVLLKGEGVYPSVQKLVDHQISGKALWRTAETLIFCQRENFPIPLEDIFSIESRGGDPFLEISTRILSRDIQLKKDNSGDGPIKC